MNANEPIEDEELTLMSKEFGIELRLDHDAEAPSPWAVWAEIGNGDFDIAGAGGLAERGDRGGDGAAPHLGDERGSLSAMSALKIAPCPFCSDPGPHLEVTDDWVTVECCCGARGSVYGDEETPVTDRKRRAVETWNAVSLVCRGFDRRA